ncbi:hypothetical protein P261_00050 [Lachnospiraceae bacterium TWA4]|nr:hypothetical protein P261_00050 [Lachnospiraceae bacterium TWA4]
MKQILCFGDSNTWGLIPGTMERYPWGVRWTSLLQELFKNEEVRIIEDGLCGRTTVFDDALRPYRNGSKELPLSLEVNDKIDLIVLMLGTNDCKTFYKANAKVIGRGIECLIKQIQSQNPSTKIVLVSPIVLGNEVWKKEYDPEFDQDSIEKSKELKVVYQELAKAYNIDFLAASDYASPSLVDMEHMTEEGHRNLSQALYKKITNRLAA